MINFKNIFFLEIIFDSIQFKKERFKSKYLRKTIYILYFYFYFYYTMCFFKPFKPFIKCKSFTKHLSPPYLLRLRMLRNHLHIPESPSLLNSHYYFRCEFNDYLRKNEKERDWLNKNCSIMDPLNPRDALYGGRCGSSLVYFNSEDEREKREGHYYDIKSLYPTM